MIPKTNKVIPQAQHIQAVVVLPLPLHPNIVTEAKNILNTPLPSKTNKKKKYFLHYSPLNSQIISNVAKNLGI